MKELVRVFGYTRGLRKFVLIIALLSAMSALLSLAIPFLIKIATDMIVHIVSSGEHDKALGIVWLAVAMMCVGVVERVIDDINGYYGDVVSDKIRIQLSNAYYKHLLTLPQSYYDDEVTGKIINRLNRAIADITQFIKFFSNNLLQTLITITISLGVMVYYSWPLALLILVLIPIYLYVTAKTSVKWQAYEKDKNEHYDIASGRFAEVIGQIRLVKSFNTQMSERKSFAKRMQSILGITYKQSFYWHKMNVVRGVAMSLVYGAIFAILFYQAGAGIITIGTMVLLITLTEQASFPLQNMSFFIDMYQRAVANSKDYAAAMSEKPEVVDEANKVDLKLTHGEVAFNSVNFAYHNKKQVLHDISFTIKPGHTLALVSESGGGKSTIANLLMRLYNPTNGAICIDGVDIATVTQRSLRDAVATVFQDATLFSGTVRDNIAYGRADVTEAQLKKASKAANAYEFISELPNGFDTEIGERGIKLSGGQKQRIAIARALLKDAPILILDEATSSLDSKSEMIVQDALDRLMKGRTVLIIAHRLSTIAGADTIVTLKKGRIDEIGAPRELAKSGGIYAQLLGLQTSATDSAQKALHDYDLSE